MFDPLSVFRLHVKVACGAYGSRLRQRDVFCLSFLRYAKLGAACASVALDFFAVGRTGFLVTMSSIGCFPHMHTGRSGGHVHRFANLANVSLTMRSSSEW